ncbi:MAG TPA: FkbM family methyltransferase [Saprospiraceae bacterium]|nr:FkbM family methyltransferase [Saprospiraceae bacterium]HMQ81553.1 FkbM family methyltransferase [Saprospiraceae bacterium]
MKQETKARCVHNLKEIERLVAASKWRRLAKNPLRYLRAMWFSKIWYPLSGKGKLATASTFFGVSMQVLLPAGMDIYLLGAKTHLSEIRLARWLIQQLLPSDAFVDVGAHYGFFSLLAAQLVGENGQVYAFEASANNFEFLQQNTQAIPAVQIRHCAVSDQSGLASFYEYPILYSEYNSLEKATSSQLTPREIEVESICLGDFLNSLSTPPQIIKIDVEGAEHRVIAGMTDWLSRKSPTRLVMEYLAPERGNEAHRQALNQLSALGWQAHIILPDGQLEACTEVEAYFKREGVDSDNLVFMCP